MQRLHNIDVLETIVESHLSQFFGNESNPQKMIDSHLLPVCHNLNWSDLNFMNTMYSMQLLRPLCKKTQHF